MNETKWMNLIKSKDSDIKSLVRLSKYLANAVAGERCGSCRAGGPGCQKTCSVTARGVLDNAFDDLTREDNFNKEGIKNEI